MAEFSVVKKNPGFIESVDEFSTALFTSKDFSRSIDFSPLPSS